MAARATIWQDQEVANLTKYQILSQSGIAALTQANSNSQNVLTLLP